MAKLVKMVKVVKFVKIGEKNRFVGYVWSLDNCMVNLRTLPFISLNLNPEFSLSICQRVNSESNPFRKNESFKTRILACLKYEP